MKIFKKLSAFLAASVLAVSAAVIPVYAENSDKVVDNAGILSDTEELALEAKISDVIAKYNYNYDIVILTSNGTDGKSIVAFADDYYDYNGYGYDSQASGLILVLDMDGRNWYISTTGKAINAFTDYGLDDIGEIIVPYFSNGSYYVGFSKFADTADDYIYQYESTGRAYDVNKPYPYAPTSKKRTGTTFLISCLTGLVIAGVICMTLKAQLKSAKMQNNAQQYIRSGSFHVTNAREYYLYRNVTKTRVESNSGGRGGSSTHRSSSGRSHGGRGGRF